MGRLYLSANEAIAYGLINAGVRFITGYPGTPSSEIIPTAQRLVKEGKLKAYVDWAINEKVAYEVAYGIYLAKHKKCCYNEAGRIECSNGSFHEFCLCWDSIRLCSSNRR